MKFIILDKGQVVFKTAASISGCFDLFVMSLFIFPYLGAVIFINKTLDYKTIEESVLFIVASIGGLILVAWIYAAVDNLFNTRKFDLEDLKQSTFTYKFSRDWSRRSNPDIVNIRIDKPNYHFRLDPSNFDELREFLAIHEIKVKKD